MSRSYLNPRHQDLKTRICQSTGLPTCMVLNCGRATMAREQCGLNRYYCRTHVEHFRRHGSYSKPSYTASQLAPYRAAALAWLTENDGLAVVAAARHRVITRMWAVGAPTNAFRLRGMSPSARSRNVWALLGARQVDADQLLAVWLAVCMAHHADPQPERKLEYRHVQAAKVLHRLAGGSHRRWDGQATMGISATELHKYPASRGVVLRYIGQTIAELASPLDGYIPAISKTSISMHRPKRVRQQAQAV